MAVKETLQLRHQLLCSGVRIQNATYDTTRHHVLTYDSTELMPHMLRLFSLRREIKSVKLFDKLNPPPAMPLPSTMDKEQNNAPKQAKQPQSVVHSLSLEYAHKLDVYVCVYSAQSVPHDTKTKHCNLELAVYNVLFLEPASLKKLVHYPGPMSHSLRCAFYEDNSDQLVLAIHKKQRGQSKSVSGSGPSALLNSASNGNYASSQLFQGQSNDGDEDRDGSLEGKRARVSGSMYNHIDILQISKRHFKRNKSHQRDEKTPEEQQVQDRIMLCIEKSRPSMLHSDLIDRVCGSQRLTRLFGVGCVSAGLGVGAMVESFVLEWRENSEHSLELIRRVMCSDVISAIALSACSSWLFTGHRSGALKVWNVATGGLQSRVLSYQLESSPLEPELSTQHRDPVDVVRLSTTTPSASSELENQTQLVPTEIMVITATRDSGLVKHWRFQVTYQSMMSDRRHSFEAAKVLSLAPERELSPKIELVGAYNTELSLINEQAKPMLKKLHLKKLVESIIATVPIWVTIDMSGFTEYLLLVLRDDVIHVLKVQSAMRVVQELPAFEDITSIRIVEHQAVPTLVSLSGSHVSSVHVSPLVSSASAVMQNASYRHQIAPPPSQHSSSFVSAMECFQLDQQGSFVVYGWSTGGLEIHSLYPSKRVRLLQDPHLNAHVTAICVIPDNRREIAQAQLSAPFQSPDTGSKAMSTRSWGGILKPRDSRPQCDALVGNASHGDANAAQDQVQSSEVYVFAGTASGQIFGWKVPFPQDPNGACRFLLESKVSVSSAHSAHVVQLVALQQDNEGAQRLMSLGADGMIKVWDIATMSIIGYVNAATGSRLSIASCVEIVTGGRDDEKHYLAVGFEDGMLAVWSLDCRHLSFSEVQVASHHERRVTSICSGSKSSEASDTLEFLTCSLDMTTIVWVIHEDKVVEKRHFDVGAPIIDFCVAENQVIVALAHEICAFEYCMQSSTTSNTVFPHSSIDKLDSHGLLGAASTELQFYQSATRPDTPTTQSDDEAAIDSSHPVIERAAGGGISSARVPTSKAKAETPITVPSALITSTRFTAKPVDKAVHSEIPAEKKADFRLQPPIHGDELCGYLEQYIAAHGTDSTMAADALNHFLSTQRLVIVSRPDFAIRKYLQENKIDPKTRLNVYDACEILLTIQSSIISKKGKYDKKQQCVQKIMHQDKIRLRKTHEKQMANRKAVISFNILGEKSIRWETIQDANLAEICTQQSSDTGGAQSSGESQEQRSSKSPSIRVPTDQTVPISDKRSDIVTHDKEHHSLPQAAAVTLDDDEVDGVSATTPLKRRRNRKLSVAESMGLKMRDDFPDPDLVNRLKLSKCFQSKWSGGYCWCTSSLELRVMWTEDSNPEEEAPLSACEECGKRIHVLKLNRSGYKPHFSLRMILGIIVDVYDELMGPSHNLLFKSITTRGSAEAAEDTDAVSAHSALFRVLTKKFGMPKVVEGKIKLLLLSITHFVHEVDAIAVFGELLGIFARNQSYDDTHVPNEMVALCVSCYSWFYSREMVINGESILGSGRNVGQNMHSLQGNASITEIEHGKHNNWQFVKLENALLCAEEMLMYPLVSPGYLRNILLYAVEYAQAYPTKPQLAEEDSEGVEANRVKRVMWLEVHRFLRLLVGEWKQQNTEFRVVEQTLFIQPLADTATTLSAAETRAIVIEKLRLILSCFIFYDHDREGVMTVEDFTNILRKLRYLWPNEDVTAEEAANSSKDSLTFENTILAARRRFSDLEGDGQICYLDFWAMLYIVGVKTLSLLKFREIPSFCRDYKLEISSDLHGLLLCYMQRSSTMLLPRGFQLGKSSLDQRTSIQHRRRVGGLHDGLFRMPKRLGTSLSLQELLAQSDPQQAQKRGVRDQIYLDGSTPSLRQNASMTAMDRFRPVSRNAGVPENSQFRGSSPVVFGIRPTGPREKPRAFLVVSAIANDDLPTNTDPTRSSSGLVLNPKENAEHLQQSSHARASNGPNPVVSNDESTFANVYVQFPFVSPRRDRIGMPTKESGQHERHTAGELAHFAEVNKHSGAYQWHSEIIKEHEEQQREVIPVPFTPLPDGPEDVRPAYNANSGTGASLDVGLSHALHRKDHTALRQSSRLTATAVEADAQQVALGKSAPDVPAVPPARKKKSEAVVVIPKIEKDFVKTRAASGMIAAGTVVHRLPPRQTKVLISDSVMVASSSPVKVPTDEVEQQERGLHSSLVHDKMVAQDVKENAEPLDTHETDAVAASSSPLDVQLQALLFKERSVISNPTSPMVIEAKEEDAARVTNEFALSDEAEDAHGSNENSDGNSGEENSEEENSNDGGGDELQDRSKESTARTASAEPVQIVERVDLNADAPQCTIESDELIVTPNAVSNASANTFVIEPTKISNFVDEKISVAVPDEQPPSQIVPPNESKSMEPAWSIRKRDEPNLIQKIQEVALVPPPKSSVEVPAPVESIPDQIVLPKDPTKSSSASAIPTSDADDAASNRSSNLPSHRHFRFSQQLAFRSTASMLNNPFRSGQWNPGDDDSDSDNETQKAKASAAADGVIDEDDDGEGIDDVELQLSPRSLQAFRASFGPKMRQRGLSMAPSLCHFGLAATASSHLSNISSSKRNLTRESNPSLVRQKTRSLLNTNLKDGDDDDTELVLYGENQAPELRGGEIVLFSEAEGDMQQNWAAFFSHAETTLFSPLKQELEGREEAQRREQEKQSRLMKKRQDQQAQDTLRLQQSRRESAMLITTSTAGVEKSASPNAAELANFRLRRMARESCQELQNELQYGVTVHGECQTAGNAQYFFFKYNPNVDGSILTLKLCVERGEAEVFMSTATKVPCVSDFMWRSVETSKGLDEGDGQKLVLYPHQLAKVISVASAEGPRADKSDAQESNQAIPFYISVMAVEAGTRFALSAMASGQKIEPSHAIQTVDRLIAQFNQLTKSFEGRATASFRSPEVLKTQELLSQRLRQDMADEIMAGRRSFATNSEPNACGDSTMSRNCSDTFSNRRQSRRQITNFESYQNEALYEGSLCQNQHEEDNDAEDMGSADTNSVGRGDDVRSFQRLLESISEKRGHGVGRSESFFLTGPTSDQFEFVQDEQAKLTETVLQLSPDRTKLTQPRNDSNQVRLQSSQQDALTMVTDRHLSTKTSKMLNRVRRCASGRLLQRLSPLMAGAPAQEVAVPGGKPVTGSSSLRVAKFTPQPVAYSLSALDRNIHHSGSAALLPQRKPVLPQVQSTSTLSSKSHVKHSPL